VYWRWVVYVWEEGAADVAVDGGIVDVYLPVVHWELDGVAGGDFCGDGVSFHDA